MRHKKSVLILPHEQNVTDNDVGYFALRDTRLCAIPYRCSNTQPIQGRSNYTVSYCHLSRILAIKGAVVRPRDVVGITGSTGRSTGEHLHITCKLDGKSVDPSILFDYIKSTQQECVAALANL